MRGASFARCIGSICALAALAVLASPVAAIEFFDERLSIHGYYEQQIRSIVRDYSFDDDWDLTQWYHILNLEIEADIAPNGFGPIGPLSVFGRIEVRYDCVWRRACGIFSSADTYGDRARRLPKRLLNGRRAGFTFAEFNGDTRRFREYTSFGQEALRDIPTPARELLQFGSLPGNTGLSQGTGVDGIIGTWDDPWSYYTFGFMNPDDCRFGVQRLRGSADLVATRLLPHTPKCKIRPIAPMTDRANYLRAGDFNPILGQGGMGALPLRPAPERPAGPRYSHGQEAQGLWYPDYVVAEMLRDGEFDNPDQNFRQAELEWNRGASQQDEKELKELYLDVELFDSSLWLRIGKQTIVWGKTELFRSQDQFNPQDLAIASLPSLEESRIALWAVRAVWSFYDVGPLEDLRFEVAMNYDQFEPFDIGRCGEPYAPLPVCDKTWGLMASGFSSLGIVGEVKPPNPWNSWKGIEVGGRLEWRTGRFSFALTDFYGYNDGGWVDPLMTFSRNVDPRTGRPRWGMETGACRTGREASCLTEDNALTHHSVNQQVFGYICSNGIGGNELDISACGLTILNSQNPAAPELVPLSPWLTVFFATQYSGQDPGGTNLFAGGASFLEASLLVDSPSGQDQVRAMTAGYPIPGGNATPLVPLVVDPNDGLADPASDPIQDFFTANGLSRVLTDEQEALLGCGPFYGTDCDLDGIDAMNGEASAQLQSWSIVDGVAGPGTWLTTDASRAQPGTLGFQGGPTCTRYENGRLYILPGCLGPGDPGYDIDVDGSTNGPDTLLAGPPEYDGQRVHPFTGQVWKNEMAIFSWNLQMFLVGTSVSALDPRAAFDPDRPFRSDGCSFAAPVFCANLAGYNSIIGAQRNTINAGGNGRYGRRDFVWHGGSNLAVRYEKRNVLGFSTDFAEDVTKSNWGLEFTWIEGLPFGNNNSFDANSDADTYNLTITVDRPTFINFLNSNRTFFFNTQVFIQYVDGYVTGFTTDGPWNVLGTFTVGTAYFQDRLAAGVTFIYDMRSNSGAALPSVTYRMTQNFTVSFGLAGWYGRYKQKTAPVLPAAIGNRTGRGAYKSFAENGLSALRERDEFWLRIRYAF